MKYSEKLKDPRWQKKRLEIMQRDDFACCYCGDDSSTLHVHHLVYSGDPWDADPDHLLTLCESCHEWEHEYRDGEEKELLKQLKLKGFSCDDLLALSTAFSKMEKFHVHDVMASVIKYTLENKALLKQLEDLYFQWLKEEVASLADTPF